MIQTSNNALGPSDLSVYVTNPLQQEINSAISGIDQALQNALDKIVDEGGGIQYQPKPLNEIATERANTGPVSMNNFRLTGLATGTANSDAVTLLQMNNALVGKYDTTTKLNQILAPDGTLSLANQKISQLLDGTQPQDAVTKAQLDAKIGTTSIQTKPDGSINWAQVATNGIFSFITSGLGSFLGSSLAPLAGGMITSITSATTAAAGAAGAALASAASIGTNLVNSASGAIQRFGQSSTWGNMKFWEKFKEGAANFTNEQAESLQELGMIDPNDVKIFEDHMEFNGALEDEVNRMQYYEVDPEVVKQLESKAALDQKLPNKEFGSDVLGSQMNLGRLNSTGAIKAPQMFSKQTFNLPNDPIQLTTKILDQQFPQAPPEFRQYTDEWGFSYWV